MSFFDISLETANKFYAWGWKASLFGAAITLIGVSLLMWGTRVRDQDFESKISETNLFAAKANQAAEEAKEKAEAERLARVRIEARLAPRSLDLVRQDSIRNKLKLFSGQAVDIWRFGETAEIMTFTLQLIAPLKGAGWSPRDWSVIGGGSATGILVMTKKGSSENIEKAATAIVAALREAEIDSGPWAPTDKWDAAPPMLAGPPWENPAPIRILIGSKP